MKNKITGRSAFLALLKDEGVTHLFGNPGTTELPIMHALKDHPDLTYVMAMQESLVVAMADGFSRASGKLVACNVHVAPGLGNAMGSLYNASFTGTPMILTAGQQEQGHGLTEPVLYGPLVQMALQVIQQNGGLPGILSKFQHGGMGDHVDSWVGTGQNMHYGPCRNPWDPERICGGSSSGASAHSGREAPVSPGGALGYTRREREAMTDKFHEECGVVGVYGHPEASTLAYLSLYALQHRGQESAGIAVSNRGHLTVLREMGLVAQIFDEEALEGLRGIAAVGKAKYCGILKSASRDRANSRSSPISAWAPGFKTIAAATFSRSQFGTR
jgi:uncharacterized protein YidB (DUF937 family)